MLAKSNPRARRGAALYLTVFSTALIVSLLGMSALTVIRIERRRMAVSVNRRTARTNANSAIELALRVIANDPNWRTTYSNGVETTPQSLGANAAGTLSFILEDSDGSLTDTDTNLRLKGIGRVGNTVQVSSVGLDGTPIPLDTLQCSAYALTAMDQNNSVTTTSGPFGTAGTFTINGTVNGDVEGNPVVGFGSATSTTTDPGPTRQMPPATVFDYYKALATEIPWGNLPAGELQEVVLSATSNPFGAVNANGIYYIRVPALETLGLTKVRIAATLVLEFEADSSLDCQNTVLWDPPVGSSYPAMVAKTASGVNIELAGASTKLKETTANTNFNPPGTPYEGVSDSDQTDKYDHKMSGLFHVLGASSTLEMTRDLDLYGVVVSEGTIHLENGVIVEVNPSLFTNPPPVIRSQETCESSRGAGNGTQHRKLRRPSALRRRLS